MPDKAQGSYKPIGLWVSVGDAWRDWCEAEQFHMESLEYVSEVTLADDADILRMGTGEELDDFTDRYGDGQYGDLIAWDEVARHHQGIIIDPYVWERRLELSWYYGWDCASGCIWDAAAIEEIKVLEEVTR